MCLYLNDHVRLHPDFLTSLVIVAPIENGALSTPTKKPLNQDRRAREHLLPEEVEKLISAAKKVGSHGSRDSAALMMMCRHALRVIEPPEINN